MSENNHEEYMTRALELAELGHNRVSPNPRVGSVVVKNNRIIGEGFHREYGDHHAEVYALNMADSRAKGSTLYVTLEPCNHHGKTPPCTDKIISSGISEVVISTLDPNPKMKGKSLKILKKAGIKVTSGILKDEGEYLLRAFAKHTSQKMPWVTFKVASSLDGKIATSTGDSKWISGVSSRSVVQKLRAETGAIIVGANTVNLDNPSLTIRDIEPLPKPLLRVILDLKGELNLKVKVVSTAKEYPTMIVTWPRKPKKLQDQWKKLGLIHKTFPKTKDEGIDLELLLKKIGELGINHVLVEGGEKVATAFLSSGLVDEVWVFIAPKLIGGKDAPGWFAGKGIGKLSDAVLLNDFRISQIENDALLKGILTGYKKYFPK